MSIQDCFVKIVKLLVIPILIHPVVGEQKQIYTITKVGSTKYRNKK
jgi:hypothetical protein